MSVIFNTEPSSAGSVCPGICDRGLMAEVDLVPSSVRPLRTDLLLNLMEGMQRR